ncbi:MAG: chromosome segregation protein SMC [Deltaproteobacteria bacterium]|nr:chromosome segregation protein SMC [Deltaproteobacteria bacterium]
MQLKRIEINGFKSFADKSVIEFPPGISCIVGPNGCGKSNIMDAIKWVMGEQSIKQLRGKSMGDVIFAGTEKRARVNLAEVSLVLSDSDNQMIDNADEYTEIMVTRRLYRSGESVYMTNKRPCRLKDVQDVFLRNGIGPRSFTIIGQGNIGAVTEASAEERRSFIEEAAGIVRYNTRKKEALSKLDSTHRNLLRLNDLIVETNKLVNSLSRQAKKAERYKKAMEELKRADFLVMVHYHEDYSRRIEKTSALLEELRKTDDIHTSQADALSLAVAQIEIDQRIKEKKLAEYRDARACLRRKIEMLENEIARLVDEKTRLSEERVQLGEALSVLTEKSKKMAAEIDKGGKKREAIASFIADLEEKLTIQGEKSNDVQIQLDVLKSKQKENNKILSIAAADRARLANLFQKSSINRDHLKRRLKQLETEIKGAEKEESAIAAVLAEIKEKQEILAKEKNALMAEKKEAKKHVEEKSVALGKQVAEVNTIAAKRQKTVSELSVIKKMDENFDWYRDGVKAVINKLKAENAGGNESRENCRKTGIVAEIIEAETGFENAVEACLGEAIQYVIVKDSSAALALIEHLRLSNAGRSGFMPSEPDPVLPVKPEPASGFSLLTDHVKIKSGYKAIALALLAGTLVADDLESAITLAKKTGNAFRIATKGGEIVDRNGAITGGSTDKLSGILEKKQSIKRLSLEVKKIENELEQENTRRTQLERELRENENRLAQITKRNYRLADRILDTDKEFFRADAKLSQARQRQEVTNLEFTRLSGEKQDIETEISARKTAMEEIESQILSIEKQAGKLKKTIEALAESIASQDEKRVDLRLALTRKTAELENINQNTKRISEFLDDTLKEIERTRGDISARGKKLSDAERLISDKQKTLVAEKARLVDIKQKLRASDSDYQFIVKEMQLAGVRISETKTAMEQVREKIHRLELDLSGLQINRENLTSRFLEKYTESFSSVLKDLKEIVVAPDFSIERTENERLTLRQKTEGMGEVNIGAIDVFAETKERHDFLVTQKDDLNAAIADLQNVIKKINRITQKKFTETFEAVNASFRELFPRLFNGGSAWLELTLPDKPLETGVELMIHPPAKKVSRLSLLSGGEKALSAIAFIFSIFLLNSASFCLLDEIDAPLDDVNVHRFNELLKIIGEKTQVIMITHNKRSMMFSNVLFGVTMAGSGVSKTISVNIDEAVKLAGPAHEGAGARTHEVKHNVTYTN